MCNYDTYNRFYKRCFFAFIANKAPVCKQLQQQSQITEDTVEPSCLSVRN